MINYLLYIICNVYNKNWYFEIFLEIVYFNLGFFV